MTDEPNEVYVQYDVQKEYVYRDAKWTRDGREYTQKSLVGPEKKVQLSLDPDMVRWASNGEMVKVTLRFIVWHKEENLYTTASRSELRPVPLWIGLQGVRTPVAQLSTEELKDIGEGSFALDFVERIRQHLAAPPPPGLIFEVGTAITGYSNRPASIVVI